MNETYPLVSVNILSHNRKEELRNTLIKVLEQNYKNIEVIVVDNASTDGTLEMIKTEFTNVKLISLKDNIGIAGWNKGFEIAKGVYILVLDDDSYPLNDTIQKGVNKFNKENNLGIVAYNIFNTRINESETKGFKDNPKSFIGCGCLINKRLIYKIGYYNESYFIYYNEIDYSARCYNNGFNIKYLSDAIIVHKQNLYSRGNDNGNPFLSKYRFYHNSISYSIFLLQNFSFYYTVIYFIKWWTNRLIICLKTGYFFTLLKAFFVVIFSIKNILKKRSVLKLKIQNFYNFGNIPFIDRDYFPNFKKSSIKVFK